MSTIASLPGASQGPPGILAAVVRLYDALPCATPIPTCFPLVGTKGCLTGWHAAPAPCNRAGKRPLLEGYPGWAENPPELEVVTNTFRRLAPCNLAIVTGVSVIVVEGDSSAAEAELVALCGQDAFATPTRERRPTRGRAYLFAAPPGPALPNRAKLGRSRSIDVRGQGGILIVPPSVHETGHRYEWVPGLAPWDVPLAPIPPALLSLVNTGNGKAPGAATMGRDASLAVPPSAGPGPKVEFLIRAKRRIADLWHGRGKGSGDESASGYDYVFAIELLKAGVPAAEVAQAIMCRPGAHRHDLAYARRTVEAALRAMRGPR